MQTNTKIRIWAITALGALAMGLSATTVAPRDFTCPVCDKPFVDTVLMSYNSFGYRPARDEIFRPPYAARRDVRICPHDLFASWEDRWEDQETGNRQRLVLLLKQPAISLTGQEKKIAGTDAAKLRNSPWWEIWWARTCDQARGLDLQSEDSPSLSLYFAGDIKSSEPWIRKLTEFYREQAIAELAALTDPEGRYLRAELMRQSGKTGEAGQEFQKLAKELSKPGAKEDQEALAEREWFRMICDEGVFLSEAADLSAGKLSAWLIPSFPQPEQNSNRSAAWSRHRIALQVLVERSMSGDADSRELLWKSVASDPKRLLAVHETLEETPGAPGSNALTQCGDIWAAWLRKLAADAAVGKLPEACRKEPDGYLDLFKSFAPPKEDEFDAKWRTEVLLPRVIRAETAGKLPETKLSRSDLAFALGKLANEADGTGVAVRRTLLRLLRQQPEPDPKVPEYGFRYALGELAKASAKPGTKAAEIDGEWKSGWWKLATGYAVGHQEHGSALARHPLVAKSYGSDGKAIEALTWNLFAARKDPVWKDKILKALIVEPWVNEERIEYALALDDEAVNEALRRRADRLRKNEIPGANNMMALYEIETVESHHRSQKMAALPIR